jgi:peptidoglycan-associated lipoprotein
MGVIAAVAGCSGNPPATTTAPPPPQVETRVTAATPGMQGGSGGAGTLGQEQVATARPSATPTAVPAVPQATPTPSRIPENVALKSESALATIYFEYDRAKIAPEAQDALAANARWLRDNPSVRVLMEGHCDERGTNEYNLALGERRTLAAKSYLTSLGIEESRMFTISYGEERPADFGHVEEAWSKNRRVEFKVLAPNEVAPKP